MESKTPIKVEDRVLHPNRGKGTVKNLIERTNQAFVLFDHFNLCWCQKCQTEENRSQFVALSKLTLLEEQGR